MAMLVSKHAVNGGTCNTVPITQKEFLKRQRQWDVWLLNCTRITDKEVTTLFPAHVIEEKYVCCTALPYVTLRFIMLCYVVLQFSGDRTQQCLTSLLRSLEGLHQHLRSCTCVDHVSSLGRGDIKVTWSASAEI